MSDIQSADPTAETPDDDLEVARIQAVLAGHGMKIDATTVRAILTAAGQVEPVDDIPVSLGMVAAARTWWVARPADSVHVLLPALYRVMERVRREEAAEA